MYSLRIRIVTTKTLFCTLVLSCLRATAMTDTDAFKQPSRVLLGEHEEWKDLSLAFTFGVYLDFKFAGDE